MTNLEQSYNKRQEIQRQEWVKKQTQLHKKFSDVKNSSYVQRPKKINFIPIVITLAVVFVGLLIWASFCDQEITRALSTWRLPDAPSQINITDEIAITNFLGRVYSYSIYANIVELIGGLPMLLALVAALSVIFWNAFRIKNKGGRITLQVVMVLIAFGYIFYRGFASFFPHLIESIKGLQGYNEFYNANKGACLAIYICGSLVLCGGIITGFFVGFRHINKQILNEMLRWSMATILAIAASSILFEFILKNVLVRERFRFIYALEQVKTIKLPDGSTMTGIEFSNTYFGGYKNWYELASNHIDKHNPYMYKDAIRSFPSGHTSSAATGLLCLFMLPLTVKACNTYKAKMCIWTIAPILYFAVALGRLVAGAHYLSDVLFGTLIAISILIIFYMVVTWSCRFFDKWTKLQIYPYSK